MTLRITLHIFRTTFALFIDAGAHNCSVCDQIVHAICGSYSEDSEGFGLNVTCNLFVRKNRINIER